MLGPLISKMLRIALAAWATVCLDGTAPEVILAQPPTASEYSVKAGFVFNFARFTGWPQGTFESEQKSLTLCIAGDTAVWTAFDTLRGKTIQGMPMALKNWEDMQNPNHCHVLFIAGSKWVRTTAILQAVKGRSVLTIGEADGFLEMGGIIKFTVAGNKVRFEVNAEAARQARIDISSKVLKLAESVIDRH